MDEKAVKLRKIKKIKIDRGNIEKVKEKIEKMKEAKGKASYTDLNAGTCVQIHYNFAIMPR